MQIGDITSDTVAALVAAVGNAVGSLQDLIALAIAVPLLFYVARRVQGMFPGARR